MFPIFFNFVIFLFAHFHFLLFSHLLQCPFHFHLFEFFQSKLNFHFDFTPTFFTMILSSLKEKLEVSLLFAKIILCQLYENQPKHLQEIERKKCNVLKKYTMQLCK